MAVCHVCALQLPGDVLLVNPAGDIPENQQLGVITHACSHLACFCGVARGGTPTGWPHTVQLGEPDCWGPEASLTSEVRPTPLSHDIVVLHV
jgi:hypothetical protein